MRFDATDRQTARDRSARARTRSLCERVAPEDWDRAIAQFDEVCQEQLYAFAKAAGRRSVTSR